MQFITKNAVHDVIDVSYKPEWNDIKAIESIYDRAGNPTTVINHRVKDAKTLTSELLAVINSEAA